MSELIVESALRALALGGVVWLGLALLRLRNPHIEMTAWRLVLMASLLMPLVAGSVPLAIGPRVPPALLDAATTPSPAEPPLDAAMTAAEPARTTGVAVIPPLDWRAIGTIGYGLVAGFLLLRLLLGLVLSWRLRRGAEPVRAFWTGRDDVRRSAELTVPVTIGRTILVPGDVASWSPVKLLAVLSHERAHIDHGDFAILLLAALNRSIFWFNPLAWWLERRIAYLAECLSDAAALDAVIDRAAYAEILIEFGRQGRSLPAAPAMARVATLGRRVRHILSEAPLPRQPSRQMRATVCAAILSLTAAACVAITPAPPPAGPAETSAAESGASLDAYVGHYEMAPKQIFTVTRADDHLMLRIVGWPIFELAHETGNEFYYKAYPARVSFVADAQGSITGFVFHENGTDRTATRMNEAEAATALAALAERVAAQRPAPGSEAALRRQYQAIEAGEPLYAELDAATAESLRRELPALQTRLAAAGPLQSLAFRGVGSQGWDVFTLKFANGNAIVRVHSGSDERLDGFRLENGP